jgi:hypothetical protein
MGRLTAYLISAGIIAFGIWIVATAELWWGSLMFWLVAGMTPIAVGWQASSMKSTTTGKYSDRTMPVASQRLAPACFIHW